MMRSLEEEFWDDPKNAPQYDPDTLQTVYPSEGPEDEPIDTRAPLFDPSAIPSGRRPLPVPDELPKASAPVAAAAPQVADDGGGYDWQRALTSLFGGGEGVSALDRQRGMAKQERAERGKAARDLAKDRRDEEKWQLERDVLAPAKAHKMSADADKARAMSQAKALSISSSPESQAMRETIASGLSMQAQRLKSSGADDFLVKQLEGAAQNMRANAGMSGVAALDAAKMFGKLGESVVSEALARAKQDETERYHDAQIGDMAEKNKIARARIAAARERASNVQPERVRAQQAKNQDKLDDEIEKAEWARSMLLQVAELKQKVNTGPLAGRVQNALQSVDLSSDEFNQLKQRIAMVSNRIIKELSGSAVTGNEWARMQDELANIMNDDRNFDTKLADMIELTESIKQRAINRYTRGETGAPMHPSNTAARVTGQAPKVNPGEPPPPDATPKAAAPKPWPGAKPGEKKRDKNTGIVWVMQTDGTLKQE